MHSFTVVSGKLRVTDPCYGMTVWCAHTLENVKNGEWFGSILEIDDRNWGRRVKSLKIIHSTMVGNRRLRYHRLDVNIGVDSGQAGFWDEQYFRSVKSDIEINEAFYDEICNITLSNEFGGNEFGVASSSGYGDGVYSLEVAEMNGEIVAANIIFIDELEENDEEF